MELQKANSTAITSNRTQGRYSTLSNESVVEVNKAIMRTDLELIRKQKLQKENLQAAIDERRRRYKYFVDLFSNPDEQRKLLEDIERSAKLLITELEQISADVPSIKTQLQANEKGTKKEIAGLLIWLNGQFNVSLPLTKEQILSLVDTIALEYGNLLLEDIATCFKRVVLGDRKGITTYALDSATVLTWIANYVEKQKEEAMNKNFNKHLSTK